MIRQYVLAAIVAVSLAVTSAFAVRPVSSPVTDARKREAARTISDSYFQWQSVEIDGKLRMDGLPVSPSVRIFMQKSRLVAISLRAPLLGEVGRFEVDTDSLLAVNKMKKVYVKAPLSELTDVFPVSVDDLQALLLGRVAVGSAGALAPDNAELVDIFDDGDGGWLVVPVDELQPDVAAYGYQVALSGRLAAFLATSSGGSTSVALLYDYPDGGTDIDVIIDTPKRKSEAFLSLDAPRQNPKPLARFRFSQKYRQVSFRDFLKSF